MLRSRGQLETFVEAANGMYMHLIGVSTIIKTTVLQSWLVVSSFVLAY